VPTVVFTVMCRLCGWIGWAKDTVGGCTASATPVVVVTLSSLSGLVFTAGATTPKRRQRPATNLRPSRTGRSW